MKKFIALISAAAIMLSVFAVSVSAAELSDAQKADLGKYEIMTGDPSGDLRLGDTITRAEAVKMICTAGGIKAKNPEAKPFADIDSSHWAYDYICAAKENGIINGDENGNFNPSGNITNEEIVKMAVCLLGYSPMADANGGYPAGYTMAASRYGVTEGLTLKVASPAIRNDVGVIFYNSLDIPLMKEPVSGSGEYVIMDGMSGYPLETLRTHLEAE